MESDDGEARQEDAGRGGWGDEPADEGSRGEEQPSQDDQLDENADPSDWDMRARYESLSKSYTSVTQAFKKASEAAKIKPLELRVSKDGVGKGQQGAWADTELKFLRVCWYGCWANDLSVEGAKDSVVYQRYTDFHNIAIWDHAKHTTDNEKHANRVAPYARLVSQVLGLD